MTRLVLVRHGETEWNIQHRAQGCTDIPLNEKGIAQAKALAEHFLGQRFDFVLSSPLSRALTTANFLAEAVGAPVRTSEELTEIRFGKWEGLSFDDIRREYPELMKMWSACPYSCVVPEAETPKEVMLRVTRCLNRIVSENPDKTIAVVSHTIPIKVEICAAIGLPFEKMHVLRLDNTGYTTLDFREDGQCFLVNQNVTVHLKEVGLQWQTLR